MCKIIIKQCKKLIGKHLSLHYDNLDHFFKILQTAVLVQSKNFFFSFQANVYIAKCFITKSKHDIH